MGWQALENPTSFFPLAFGCFCCHPAQQHALSRPLPPSYLCVCSIIESPFLTLSFLPASDKASWDGIRHTPTMQGTLHWRWFIYFPICGNIFTGSGDWNINLTWSVTLVFSLWLYLQEFEVEACILRELWAKDKNWRQDEEQNSRHLQHLENGQAKGGGPEAADNRRIDNWVRFLGERRNVCAWCKTLRGV